MTQLQPRPSFSSASATSHWVVPLAVAAILNWSYSKDVSVVDEYPSITSLKSVRWFMRHFVDTITTFYYILLLTCDDTHYSLLAVDHNKQRLKLFYCFSGTSPTF